jgi:hypothetical protein
MAMGFKKWVHGRRRGRRRRRRRRRKRKRRSRRRRRSARGPVPVCGARVHV